MAAERGIKKIWVDSWTTSNAVYKWGVVNQTAATTVGTPAAVATQPFGIALDDGASGDVVPVMRIGRCYGIDTDGDLNRGDPVSGKNAGAEYHKLEKATVNSTAGHFGIVVGKDASTADDLVLIDVDFTNLPI